MVNCTCDHTLCCLSIGAYPNDLLPPPSLPPSLPLQYSSYTPGRFLHVLVEMELKLHSLQYVVFDEADRLFEMGFSEQLLDIIRRLPEMRYSVSIAIVLSQSLH